MNTLLENGFAQNELIELTGPPKSGKTTLALYIIFDALLQDHYSPPRPPSNLNSNSNIPSTSNSTRRDQGEALYIDTLNTFSAETALEIVQFLIQERRRLAGPTGGQGGKGKEEAGDYEIAVRVLDRLNVATCFDISTTLETIESAIALNPPSPSHPVPVPEEMMDTTEEDAGEQKGRLKIVLIDNLSTLFPTLDGGSTMGNTSMGNSKVQGSLIVLMRRIRELAHQHHLLFLVRLSSLLPKSVELTRREQLINPSIKGSYKAQPPPLSQFRLLPTSTPSSHSSSSTASTNGPSTTIYQPSLGSTFPYLTNRTIMLSRGEEIWGHKYEGVEFSLGGGGKGEGRKKEGKVGIVELVRNDKGPMRGWFAFERVSLFLPRSGEEC